MLRVYYLLAMVAVALVVRPAGATEPFARGGTTTVAILESPVGARNVGMGGTGVANIEQSTSSYYNPASLAWARDPRAGFGYEEGPFDIKVTDSRMNYGHRWGDDGSANVWRLGGEIGYTRYDMEPQPVRTIFLPDGTGELYDPSDSYVTACVAGAWERGGQSIALGVSGKYLRMTGAEDAESWLLDYGAIAAVRIGLDESVITPSVGVSVSNSDTGLEYDDWVFDILGTTRYGGGVDFQAARSTVWGREVAVVGSAVNAEYVDRERLSSYWAVGWELSAVEFAQFRAGYQWYDENGQSALCLGGGLGWEFGPMIVQADYAHFSPRNNYLSTDLSRDTFAFTLGARL